MAAAPHAGAHTERRFAQKNQLKSAENVALHFRERATLQQAKSMTYLTSTRANCRRWVSGFQIAREGNCLTSPRWLFGWGLHLLCWCGLASAVGEACAGVRGFMPRSG